MFANTRTDCDEDRIEVSSCLFREHVRDLVVDNNLDHAAGQRSRITSWLSGLSKLANVGILRFQIITIA